MSEKMTAEEALDDIYTFIYGSGQFKRPVPENIDAIRAELESLRRDAEIANGKWALIYDGFEVWKHCDDKIVQVRHVAAVLDGLNKAAKAVDAAPEADNG